MAVALAEACVSGRTSIGCEVTLAAGARADHVAVRRGALADRGERRAGAGAGVRGADGGVGHPVALDRDDGGRPVAPAGRARRRSWTWDWTRSSTRGGTALNATWRDDKFHDECGLFGIWNHAEAANVTYLGLYALQHRGQESAGIVGDRRPQLPSREGDGTGGRRLQSGAPAAAARPPRHRPRALLDGGLVQPAQRPADHRDVRARADRDRPQRQPDQRRCAPQGAWSATARSSSRPPTPR